MDIGFAVVGGKGRGIPGQLEDFNINAERGLKQTTQPKGVYSKAIELVVEDTIALWNKPSLPQWKGEQAQRVQEHKIEGQNNEPSAVGRGDGQGAKRTRTPKKLHLVILTHGIHSNVSADLLYLKESIDATTLQARLDAKERRSRLRNEGKKSQSENSESANVKIKAKREPPATAPLSGGQDQLEDDEDRKSSDDDDEQVIVRGFFGNAIRTERGIQYLGKRLAKFVLTTTYPDQPFLPASKSSSRRMPGGSDSSAKNSLYGAAAHTGSSIHKGLRRGEQLPYTFTSISFIGHSLGGLVQTYAIAYIHKHSPSFFKQIKPTNFIAMASPLLGLSNENPMYVKFALDFGLVGRTGQDLGLTWRAPTLARSGWSAMLSGFGGGTVEKEPKRDDPRAKPLLRILPTGPAHQVLKMFRNRTVYSNAVNDGIVPLRTSCLLFLDWRGLDRVENARRENGLLGTMASFGWAELTGANSSSHRPPSGRRENGNMSSRKEDDASSSLNMSEGGSDVPQPSSNATRQDTQFETAGPPARQFSGEHHKPSDERSVTGSIGTEGSSNSPTHNGNTFSDLISFFRPGTKTKSSKKPKVSRKVNRAYKRAQTVQDEQSADENTLINVKDDSRRSAVTRGDSLVGGATGAPPPKTSVFDAAADILNPPIPTQSWLIDPSSRSRTIFHDRIYHPEDIPPPPLKRPRTSQSLSDSASFRADAKSAIDRNQPDAVDASGMKVEEKIARAYHRDLSWRKVLVRLEPDAHNNMIVRRMFANAYGWDVIKHLCDTHFADTYSATTRDEDETNEDRAANTNNGVSNDGEEVRGQTDRPPPDGNPLDSTTTTTSEVFEASDKVSDLQSPKAGAASLSSSADPRRPHVEREDSAVWNDAVLEGSDDDEDDDQQDAHGVVGVGAGLPTHGPLQTWQRFWTPEPSKPRAPDLHPTRKLGPVPLPLALPLQLRTQGLQGRWDGGASTGTSEAEITEFLTHSPGAIEGHRGLGVVDYYGAGE